MKLKASKRFKKLINSAAYNEIAFHRVIKNKLVQISFENLFSEKQILFDIANNISKANLEKKEKLKAEKK